MKKCFAYVKKWLIFVEILINAFKKMPTIRPQTITGTRPSNYQGVANLANNVIASMTANANFATPVPALADIQTELTTLEGLIAAWGPVGNRGSHATLLALRAQSQLVYSMLLAETEYVQNTAQIASGNDYPAMAVIINSSGFGVKNNPNPQGLLALPQDFHQVFAGNVNPANVKLDWRKPLGLNSPNNVKSYQVLRSTDDDISTATVQATVTKTTWTDENAAAGTTYFYWVRGVNAAGIGAPTASLEVHTPVA